MTRWIARVFVSAAVRRIAAIFVLALLGWLGIGTARAAVDPCLQGGTCDQGTAFARCKAAVADTMAAFPPSGSYPRVAVDCTHSNSSGGGGFYTCSVYTTSISTPRCHTSGGNSNQAFHYSAARSCSARSDKTGKPWQSSASDVREGTISCEDNCEAVWSPNGDGTATGFFGATGKACTWPLEDCSSHPGTYWNPVVMGCEYPEPETCPAGQMKNAAGNCVDNQCPAGMVEGPAGTCINEKNECPAGDVKSPTGQCLPGEGQCAQGEARGKDGTCKRDSDGDGVPDNEDDDPTNDDDKESFSGGDNCNSPPACNGSPIACGQARIQWRIECNTRRNETIAGGACNAMPICKGEKCNAMEYAQLLQQWRTTCALEKLGQGSGGLPGGGNQDIIDHMTALKQAEVAGLAGMGTGNGHGDVDPDSIWRTVTDGDFNPNLFGGGQAAQCSFGVTLFGSSFEPPAQFWTAAGIIGWIVVASAYLWIAVRLGS